MSALICAGCFGPMVNWKISVAWAKGTTPLCSWACVARFGAHQAQQSGLGDVVRADPVQAVSISRPSPHNCRLGESCAAHGLTEAMARYIGAHP